MILNEATLHNILARLPGLSVAVVGDLFLDKYLELDAALTETSVETGLEAYQITRVRCDPGAGGTVLNNLRALGVGRLVAVSVIGDDGEGYELLRALRSRDVLTEHVVVSPQRMTPTYTKPMLSQVGAAARELNRLDIKNRRPQSAELDRELIRRLEELAPQVDAVVIADQVTERNQGVITDAVRDHLAGLAERLPQVRFLADSRARIGLFRRVIVKPNASELRQALVAPEEVRAATGTDTRATGERAPVATVDVARGACALSSRTGSLVLATVGAEGVIVADGSRSEHVPGVPVTGPIDIVGAGDATMAGIVCGLCAGATPAQAARLGCLVASITIQQLGTTGTATPAQVAERFRAAGP